MPRLAWLISILSIVWGIVSAPQAFADPHAYAVPFVPSATNSAQQGFVRILSRSEESGYVRITPIDDSGRRFPVIRIHLGPLAAVHFNSLDLENGNIAKGLSRGVGAGTGDWRLEVETDFPFEALAYVRTSDGFVTSVFETANWWDVDVYWVPFFNPGSNRNQVSKLRLVNPKNQTANVAILGVDDAGKPAPEGQVVLSLPPRASRTVTAQELEDGTRGLSGRLGDGSGKWRLWVKSDRRLHVLSLLESPTGNITNLSTGSWWTRTDLPLLLSDSDPDRQGFIRIVNNSSRDGEVKIIAVDDNGTAYHPVTLTLEPFAAAHFNSSDLANGNRTKGLSDGIGAFEGDLRLDFETDLVITPLAYVRTVDGFVTSVHDLVLTNYVDKSWVSITNPGSNRNQESLLRIINPTDRDNSVEIWGRDDNGFDAPGGTVSLSLPPRSARTITAYDLEQGGDGLSGRLGDGTGKWALFISSEESIQAMSLLNSPTGNLTNLSATPYAQRLRITNAPTAHDISLSNDLSNPYIDVQLMATDPDGDPLGFVLDGKPNGEGYEDAYVEWETGKLLATLVSEVGQDVQIPFRATDGNEWSDRAFVTISIDEDSGDRALGAQDVDPEDYANLARAFFDDAIRSDFEDGTLSPPRAIDLAGNFPRPGNQGMQSSCVGWAVSYLKSYQERLEERWEFTSRTRFSPAWIYNQINGGQDGGSNPLNAMVLIQSKGAATLATMPYNARDYRTQPSAEAIEEASNFLGGETKRIDSVKQYKAALAHRVPFVLGIPVYPSLNTLSGNNAVYNDLSGEREGGHAVVVVGYDEDRYGGAFKVLNSWGYGWGDHGVFWIPYDTFRESRFNPHTIAITMEDRTNGEVAPPVSPTQRNCGATDEQLPNLTISSWSAEYQPQLGGQGQLRWRIVNNGTAPAPAGVDVNLMLSPDRNISSADHWVIYEEIPFEIGPGNEVYRDADNELAFTFPNTIRPGTYYIAMWVDDVSEVRECDEDDNVSIGQNLVDLQSTKPDLTAASWYANWDQTGNGKLEYRVTNIGSTATTRTDWQLSLVLHSEPTIEYGNNYVLFREQGNILLQPGGSVYRDANSAASFDLLNSPYDGRVPLGMYYMTLWVDEFDVVDESNELNNRSLSNGLVTISAGRSAPKLLGAKQMESATLGVGPGWNRERFNGSVPPDTLTRRVQIVEDSSGVRRVKFLNHEAELEPGLYSKGRTLQPQGLAPQAQSSDFKSVFAKRNVSADIVTGPIRESRSMPQ